jgi:hypothetical protein
MLVIQHFYYQDLTRNDIRIYGCLYNFSPYQDANVQTIQMMLSSISVQAGEDITIKINGAIGVSDFG